MGQVVEAARPAVALAGGINEGEVTRPGFLLEADFERRRQRLGVGSADEPAHRDRRPVADGRDGGGEVNALGSSPPICHSTSRR